MPNNINSFAENMNALVRTSNNQMQILNALQNSLINNSATTYINLTDPYTGAVSSYQVPAFQGVINRLEGVENSIRALLSGNGIAELNDGTSREIQITPLAKIPNSVYMSDSPTTFDIDSNWFFEDLMFPGITVKVDLKGQVDLKSDRIRVRILLCLIWILFHY